MNLQRENMIQCGIVGWKNSGKTFFAQKLIEYFSKKRRRAKNGCCSERWEPYDGSDRRAPPLESALSQLDSSDR